MKGGSRLSLYETTVVIDSLQKAEDIQNTVAKVESFIQNNGGTIKNKEEWGKKRLSYEINRKQYGTYFHLVFEGPSTFPGLLEREFRLEESILRYLTVVAAEPVDEEVVAEAEPVDEEVVAEAAADDVAVSATETQPEDRAEESGDDEAVATAGTDAEEEPVKNA